MRRSKYGNIKTVVDGITFDSKKEAEYYGVLKLRQAAGEIASFELQPKFQLLEKSPDMKAVIYKADFRVVYPDGKSEIVDVKGYMTDVYKIKRAWLWQRHGIRILEI